MPLSNAVLGAIYQKGREAPGGTTTDALSAEKIAADHSANLATVQGLIDDVKHLLRGTTFKRAMSVPQAAYFLERIRSEYPANILENALTAIEGHIVYFEDYRHINLTSLRQCVRQYSEDTRPILEPANWPTPPILEIANEINDRAAAYDIGELQRLRVKLKGLSRRAGSKIFRGVSKDGTYALHHGGRGELQFNIGFEDDGASFRFGVAYSLETSRSLPAIDALFPSIQRFNEFFFQNPTAFNDLSMWWWAEGERSSFTRPAPIAPSLIRPGAFIMLGKVIPTSDLNVDEALELFDRLLPLYQFVESGGLLGTAASEPPKFQLRPGSPVRLNRTSATLAQRTLDISLRHNVLQCNLVESLRKQFGQDNVGYEQYVGTNRIDVVAKNGNDYWFYEIKTATTARGCIREAMGQLLDYAYWPGCIRPARLIVVGEAALDLQGNEYIAALKGQFGIPLEYEQIGAE